MNKRKERWTEKGRKEGREVGRKEGKKGGKALSEDTSISEIDHTH